MGKIIEIIVYSHIPPFQLFEKGESISKQVFGLLSPKSSKVGMSQKTIISIIWGENDI